MVRFFFLVAIIFVIQAGSNAIADDEIDLSTSLTGVWAGLDDSRCYVRQYERDQRQAVSVFCEHPQDQASYVFSGFRGDAADNRSIEGALVFVPKGNRVLRREARFRIGTYTKRGKTPSDTKVVKALYPLPIARSGAIDPTFVKPLIYSGERADEMKITRTDYGVSGDHFPAPGGTQDLTGIWYSNDGGVYYVTQRGPFVSWFGEHPNGAWSNVADGARYESREAPNRADALQGKTKGSGEPLSFNRADTLKDSGELVALNWADVPKGGARGSGELGLRMDGPNRLVRTSRTGGFGGSEWVRESDVRWIQPDPIGENGKKTRQIEGALCPFDSARSDEEGDREFGGNGPSISTTVELSIEPGARRSVRATVNFTATEIGGDRSTVAGNWTRTIYIAPENRTIAEILSDTSSSIDFVSAHSAGLEIGMGGDMTELDSYGIRSFEPIGMQALPDSEAVSRLFYVGDTGGNDISDDENCLRETRVQFIEFNPLQVRLN